MLFILRLILMALIGMLLAKNGITYKGLDFYIIIILVSLISLFASMEGSNNI